VAHCESSYLARRKTKSPSKRNRKIPATITAFSSSYDHKIDAQQAKQYASISGDYNPIHLSGIAAKLFGMKGKIIHGWYLVSKAAQIAEKHVTHPLQKIEVSFISPVEIPSLATFLSTNNNTQVIANKKLAVNINIS